MVILHGYEAMQEELHQFDRTYKSGNYVDKTFWQERNQAKVEEGIDFEESFAPVARFGGYQDLCRNACTSFSNLSGWTVKNGISINVSIEGEAKYTLEILKKHGMEKGQSIGTPMATKPKLDADLSGEPVDQTDYRSKIGSLMYLTSSRPDIMPIMPIALILAKKHFWRNTVPSNGELASMANLNTSVLEDPLRFVLGTLSRIHKDGDGDASFQLKSNSLPHAHAQTTKTFYKHQDSRIMKAQELKTRLPQLTLITRSSSMISSLSREIVSNLFR
ncbi:retrovirus-related pol polyprotein from transposon TNT 1-94 [Tanacetum coccineum]|uniref:Retrovirus-related pol polyprotein from transposon TNT 1-94 n=1 Tax=Tanacetum coccineum TaxID=301880 RepID=A0ABQ5H7T0_9ASTR